MERLKHSCARCQRPYLSHPADHCMYCGEVIPDHLLLTEAEKNHATESKEASTKEIEEDYKKMAELKSRPRSFYDYTGSWSGDKRIRDIDS